MNKQEIKEILDKSELSRVNTLLDVKESLVFHNIIDDTRDTYANFLITQGDFDDILKESKIATSRTIAVYNIIYNDAIGYSAAILDGSKKERIVEYDLNILNIGECIKGAKKLYFKNDNYTWLLDAIAEYYSKKIYNNIKELNEYREILESLK